MSSKKMLLIFIALPCALSAQTTINNPIYHGGNADGHSIGRTFTTAPVATIMRGGIGDGHYYAAFLSSSADKNLMHGGVGDGHSYYNYTQPTASSGIARGGTGDGYHHQGYLQLMPSIYEGGISDGNTFNGSSAPLADAIFKGGIGDGWASNAMPITPLPVSLLSFTGRQQEDVHILSWLTASEKEVDNYIVQRSANASSFTNIGVVKAMKAGRSNEYTYVDSQPMEGNNYYRLEMARVNGNSDYSNTILLYRVGGQYMLAVYPNPAASVLNVKFQGSQVGKEASMLVFDMQGRTVLVKNKPIASPIAELNIAALIPGTYILKVVLSARETAQVTFIKR